MKCEYKISGRPCPEEATHAVHVKAHTMDAINFATLAMVKYRRRAHVDHVCDKHKGHALSHAGDHLKKVVSL